MTVDTRYHSGEVERPGRICTTGRICKTGRICTAGRLPSRRSRARGIAWPWLLACLLACFVGCKPQRPTEFTVSGKPIEHWLQVLRTGEVQEREKAVDSLGNVGPAHPSAVPALGAALLDKHVNVRRRAALALVKIGPDACDALDALTVTAKKDKDSSVRLYASMALAKLNCGKRQ